MQKKKWNEAIGYLAEHLCIIIIRLIRLICSAIVSIVYTSGFRRKCMNSGVPRAWV
jgi:hypothetical protein